MRFFVENGGPLPKIPREPEFPLNPEMPLLPSVAVRNLIQASKRSGMRKASRNNFPFNRYPVLNVKSITGAVVSKRMLLRVGILKASRLVHSGVTEEKFTVWTRSRGCCIK